MASIRARYDDIFETCARTPGGFEHEPDRRGFYDVSREERVALWDRLYDEPGFGIWLQNFREIFMDEEANAEFSEYIADRIRRRVHDPVTAEKLIPKDHGFGIQRVPLRRAIWRPITAKMYTSWISWKTPSNVSRKQASRPNMANMNLTSSSMQQVLMR